MSLKIKREWFTEPNRTELSKYVESKLSACEFGMSHESIYESTCDQFAYSLSVLNANRNVMQFIKYSCVDCTTFRPRLVSGNLTSVQTYNEFIESIASVKNKLTRKPPSNHYASLVYHQTLISILTNMELDNA